MTDQPCIGDVITVEWIDACRYQGTYPMADRAFFPHNNVTVGIYMGEGEAGGILIAWEIVDDGHGSRKQRDVQVIPQEMVKRVCVVKKEGERK